MAYWAREWRRIVERMMSIERVALDALRELEEVHESIYNSRLREIAEGELEPLYQLFDMGDEIAIVVDISGVNYETIDVRVYEDHVEVSAEIKREETEETRTARSWSYHASRYHGVITLPVRVDPATARVEKRGSVAVIRVRKA